MTYLDKALYHTDYTLAASGEAHKKDMGSYRKLQMALAFPGRKRDKVNSPVLAVEVQGLLAVCLAPVYSVLDLKP